MDTPFPDKKGCSLLPSPPWWMQGSCAANCILGSNRFLFTWKSKRIHPFPLLALAHFKNICVNRESGRLRQLRPLAVEDAVRVDHLRPELRPAREDAHASPEVAVGYLRSPVPPQDLKRALQPRVQFNFKTCSKTQTQISTTMRFDKLTVHRCT